ncbi:hypothetical protein QAD02_015476 [Eretmocerus hayati]|uniref:Uncharacterized protein n=1 Tax=Eretmocerus hayati TaxID=131215 RepID=A0ACC2P7X7_9HYME|nr:hypothetical protein QAD02_015476 [Eretmocerus hayati]
MAHSMMFTLLITLWIVTLANAGEQRFAETPSAYQEVSQGEDVRLRCRVHDKRGQCIWQKDRRPVGIHPDKYEWAGGGLNGDCSLIVKRASLEFDDGLWECQVTPGDFTRQDALTSAPARLLVRVKPRKPQLEYAGALLTTGLTLREGQEAAISCVSRYGNPPALIKWFIGDDEVHPMKEQTNATEVDSAKTWVAHSTLRVHGTRENHNKPIRCQTIHPTSPEPETTESRFDIHYSPEVRLETSPKILSSALEDSASFVSLRCIADSNPAASIKWYKDSSPIMLPSGGSLSMGYNRSQAQPGGSSLVESEVRFEPIKREDAGLYSCRAQNIVGESAPASYRLDVQYGPKPRSSIDPLPTLDMIEETGTLTSNVAPFECPEFDANPPAQYFWYHYRGGKTEKIDNRVSEQYGDGGRRLRLQNVNWPDEGEYRCVAYNVINGVRREMPSELRFVFNVIGPPEIQLKPSPDTEDGMVESTGWAGERAHRLGVKFCSRPAPIDVAWQWGSSILRHGDSISPKYIALPIEPIYENKVPTNCYWATLEIHDLGPADARLYTLVVESEKGRASTNLRLLVRDPTELRIIAAAGALGLLALMLLCSIGLYSLLRSRRKHREYRKEDDEASVSAEAYYGAPPPQLNGSAGNTPTDGQLKAALHQGVLSVSGSNGSMYGSSTGRKPSFGGIGGIEGGLAVMYDYDQIGCKQRTTMSPEALKVRRAPAVLQPPTIV